MLVGRDDSVDVFVEKDVLALSLVEVLGGVDEEDVVGFLALLENENADGNSRRVEEVGGQADDGVDVAVF